MESVSAADLTAVIVSSTRRRWGIPKKRVRARVSYAIGDAVHSTVIVNFVLMQRP